MKPDRKRILVLAPHTDDGEFGCGGTLARYLDEGADVYYVAFSSCEDSLPLGVPTDTLKKELQIASAQLGIAASNLLILNYPVRRFPTHRQEILEDMVRLNTDIKPDLVFLPSTYDTHQDHNTISEEGFRAFKRSSLLGYELPWNNLTFTTNSFVFLTNTQLERKIEAIRCYKSQIDRNYSSADSIRALAITRGTQIGVSLAEAFEAIRWIIK